MVSERIGSGGPVAVICGPTAVGKSEIACAVAPSLRAEIVAADSRTVFRGMNIGTAKPGAELLRRVPHHLLDVADPSDAFTLADYQRLAREAVAEIRARGRLPLLVGGTGLYIRAVVDDLVLPPVPPDPFLRARLEAEARLGGRDHLHSRLRSLDPAAASRIDPNNVRRVVRALEIAAATGLPASRLQGRGAGIGPAVMVGLVTSRPDLYRRIDARVDEQLSAGLVDEVRGLLDSGVAPKSQAMAALGYKEIAEWLAGESSYEEAVDRLKRNTRRYAKRQLTWFRGDPRIEWVDVGDVGGEALAARVRAIIERVLDSSPDRRK